MGNMKVVKSEGNVFRDLGFEKEEAANLKIRADLMIKLRRYIKEEGLRQEDAAALFGVTQPRISDLVNRKINKFSIDTLVNMLATVGMTVEVDIAQSEDTSTQTTAPA